MPRTLPPFVLLTADAVLLAARTVALVPFSGASSTAFALVEAAATSARLSVSSVQLGHLVTDVARPGTRTPRRNVAAALVALHERDGGHAADLR